MPKPKPGQRKGYGRTNVSRLSAPKKRTAAASQTAAPSPTPKPGFFGIGSFGSAAEALSGKGRRSAPARSNAGGAVKGKARAALVKSMNATKKAAPKKKPTK